MNNKVLIADGVHVLLIEGLKAFNLDCDYRPAISLSETKEIIHHYIGIVVNTKTTMDQDMMDRAIKLKFIARLGSGMDMIDLDYAKKKKIEVMRSPEGNSNAVAEHALGMLLSLFNNLNRADREVRNKQWNREKNRGKELKDRTIGIIGYGHTGRRFAHVLSGLGVTIQYYDPYCENIQSNSSLIKKVNLEAIQQTSDIISFHVPLTDETFYMCDVSFMNKCKKGVILMNTSRGKVVNLKDLVDMLQNEQVSGACLDVIENEILDTLTMEEEQTFQMLCEMENVVLSPHVAGWTFESKQKIALVLLDKIRNLFR